jgi:hypothetical protein
MKTKYRQGDVLIELIAELPKNLKPLKTEAGRFVLAHGEVTGHAHAVEAKGCTLLQDETGATFLDVQEAVAALKHEEHGTIELPAGAYRVLRQSEYAPDEIRQVAD